MAITNQIIKDEYALYQGDCIELMDHFPNDKIHLSIYSPPFSGLYNYTSSPEDLSNCKDYKEFFDHYEYLVSKLYDLTMPGRMTCVHCMDLPSGNSGKDYMVDFPGDIIRLHEKFGFHYIARYSIWKEPLGVRNRTMAKNLAHKTIVEDSSKCSVAAADYLLVFRKKGENPVPISHPTGLDYYAGAREIPRKLLRYRNYKGKQTENKYSHWIWRQYASAFWDDIRIDNVLPYKKAKDDNDEKHVHPLQLDVIERCVILWSNPGEIVFSPFAGVGSEVYGACKLGRKGIGAELKDAYFNQSVKNLESLYKNHRIKPLI